MVSLPDHAGREHQRAGDRERRNGQHRGQLQCVRHPNAGRGAAHCLGRAAAGHGHGLPAGGTRGGGVQWRRCLPRLDRSVQRWGARVHASDSEEFIWAVGLGVRCVLPCMPLFVLFPVLHLSVWLAVCTCNHERRG